MEGYDGSTSRYMQSKQYIILKFNLLCGLPKADCIQRCKELDFLQKYWSYQHNNLLLRYSSTYSSSRLLWFLFNDLVQLFGPYIWFSFKTMAKCDIFWRWQDQYSIRIIIIKILYWKKTMFKIITICKRWLYYYDIYFICNFMISINFCSTK